MKAKHPHLKWQVMNMLGLDLENETFDVVLDKGCMDALLTSKVGFYGHKDRYQCDGKKLMSCVFGV